MAVPSLPALGSPNWFAWAQGIDSAVRNPAASSGSPVVNVKDFGAKGDGTTDDTAAIQAVLNTAAGKQVFFPGGTYLVTGLTINVFCAIKGVGALQTVVKLKASANADVFTVSTSAMCDFEDMRVDGNRANNVSGAGIVYAAGPDTTYRLAGTLTRVRITQCAGNGLVLGMSRNLGMFLASHVTFCGGNGIHIDRAVDWYLNGSEVGSCTGYGIYANGDSLIAVQTTSYGNSTNVYIDNGCGSSSWTDCVFDDSVLHTMEINSSFDPRVHAFTGCSFGNVGTSAPGTFDVFKIVSVSTLTVVGCRFYNRVGQSAPRYVFNSTSSTARIHGSANTYGTPAAGILAPGTALVGDETRLWIPADNRFQGSLGSPTAVNLAGIPAWQFAAAVDSRISTGVRLPQHWTTFDVEFHYVYTGTGTGAVRWRYEEAWLGAGDTVAMTAINAVPDTVGAQNTYKTVVVASGRTLTANKRLYIGATRSGSNAADTLADNVRLLGVMLKQPGT